MQTGVIRSSRFRRLLLSPFPAPARTPEPEPRKNPALVPMEINHPVVAVDIHGCGEEKSKQDNDEGAKEQQRKEPEAAAMTGAALLYTKPTMGAMAHRIRHLALAFGTFDQGHGHSSWTPENSSKYRHDSHSSSTYWKEIPSIIPSTTQHGWPVGFIFLKHSSHVVALLGWWFFQ